MSDSAGGVEEIVNWIFLLYAMYDDKTGTCSASCLASFSILEDKEDMSYLINDFYVRGFENL